MLLIIFNIIIVIIGIWLAYLIKNRLSYFLMLLLIIILFYNVFILNGIINQPVKESRLNLSINEIDPQMTPKDTLYIGDKSFIVFNGNDNNDYYLRHNRNGDYDINGEIYIKDNIIYGHNMRDHTLFSDLDKCNIGECVIYNNNLYSIINKVIVSGELTEFNKVDKGDLSLCTCDYSIDNGRLLIVLKKL